MIEQSMKTKPARWLWVIVPAMVLPTFGALLYFTGLLPAGISQVIYTGTKLFTLLWPFIVCFLIIKRELPLPKMVVTRIDLVLGLGTGVVASLLIIGLERMVGSQFSQYHVHIQRQVTELGIADRYWLFGFFLAFIHSGIEEIYWRWFVWGGLRRVTSRRKSHLWAAFAFAAHHVVVLWVFFNPVIAVVMGMSVAFAGWSWSQLFERTKSLWASWLSHVCVDLAILWIGYQWII